MLTWDLVLEASIKLDISKCLPGYPLYGPLSTRWYSFCLPLLFTVVSDAPTRLEYTSTRPHHPLLVAHSAGQDTRPLPGLVDVLKATMS